MCAHRSQRHSRACYTIIIRAPCLAVKGKVHAVIDQNVVGFLSAEAVGEKVVLVVGAAQDRLGWVFGFHGAGGLNFKTRIARVIEPLGHSVGEEAKFIPFQEAVKAAGLDAAGVEVDDLLGAFVDSCTLKLL